MPSTIERAFELAASGKFTSITHLSRQLDKEGHENVRAHLSGKATKDKIARMMKDAQALEQA